MNVKIFRRGSARCIGLLSALITILLCLYYISMGQPSSNSSARDRAANEKRVGHNIMNDKLSSSNSTWNNWLEVDKKDQIKKQTFGRKNSSNVDDFRISSSLSTNENWGKCRSLYDSDTDITTMEEYAKFDFQPEWMKTKEYWDKTFEARFEELRKNPERPPLKVIIVPHSHNDPGWLRTYINYFELDSRQILNLIVTKLQEYKDMTFIWSEICILQLWWDQAHPQKQRALKHLVQSGRLEITTGGWVMTDEANVHLYAMVDQLIEGHQWVKNHLNVTPRVGWSIDPFGHGSTVPFLLSSSDFDGAIIQRIHYAWKQWFAKHQAGDFVWKPSWNRDDEYNLLTHNMPFDIYSIKHSCGPHPFICLNFDFRKIPGEYTEYSIKAQFINNENVAAKADLLMEQYARTASLFNHNVALIPLGDDFRYNKEREFEQQYINYKKLVDYINSHKEKYGNAEVSFGTPADYFKTIKERQKKFPSLKGDFFVYSDIFTEGRPAYWSGYYTTRPSYKILSRDLEHNLRSLEILFTLAFNKARQSKNYDALRIFEKNYEKIIHARRNLGLFQHHDAITGTSKSNVMRDYGTRIFTSIQDSMKLQQSTIEMLLQKDNTLAQHGFILSELERDSFNKIPRKTPIHVTQNRSVEFVVYNSLAQERLEVVLLRTLTPNVRVLNSERTEMEIQINPVWNITDASDALSNMYASGNTPNRISISEHEYEIMFVSKLPALSLSTFTVEFNDDIRNRMATIYCNECHNNDRHKDFEVRNKLPGDVQLENQKMRLLFDERSGFLKTVTMKNMGKPIQCAINFGAYRSAQFHSGAYLFKTDPDHQNAEKDVLEQYSDIKILITSGPIASDVTVIYGPFLAHTVRIYNTKTDLDQAVYIENDVDFEPPPKNRETELFMRLVTDIENGEVPEFYSDLNGFQFQKRVKVNQIGIEGNYFPITSAAFIQDDRLRVTLLTTHAQGSASLEPGQLEVMLDRRTLYDDYRGMGEGVVDSRLTRHRFWLLLETKTPSLQNETKSEKENKSKYNVLSLFGNHMSNGLNYPANIYFVERVDDTPLQINRAVTLLRHSFPCDFHLLTLRTQTEVNLPLFPSQNALLVIQRQGHDCSLSTLDNVCTKFRGLEKQLFTESLIYNMTQSSLTGLHTKSKLDKLSDISIEPMEVRTFILGF
ncbi:Alpha-mannosidase [Sergentomyia squamirostris]